MVTAAMKLKDTCSLEESCDQHIKSRDITLPTKVYRVKAMVFPAVMYGSESWTIKKAEHWTIDAFELWCWRRLLRVLWTARRSNQWILSQFRHSVVSNSLRSHELLHARPPCPSSTPGVYPNTCPLIRWCHPAISFSVIPFSSCLHPSQHEGLF